MSKGYSFDVNGVVNATPKADKPGQLYYVIGPSGAGKDSIISALREQFVKDLVVAHRYITRAADAGGENHIELSDDEFFIRYSRNMFAMSWQAHGMSYGIGQEVHQWMDAGLSVVVNGSRAYLDAARDLFGERLVPVVVSVKPEVLEARLRARGRESGAEIALRLQRAADYCLDPLSTLNNTLCIDNSGTLEESIAQFARLKEQAERLAEPAGGVA
ncbi:ribose 1,5-bisphosphokinase [Vibrio sp. Isolate22]|uniref:ribose 1,5-bisphosphokinase n=1 Tax=Vibrio sp. Isolate22 TaxID=2908532 RepID=UPI001EFED70A|nr:ribose 1,5-bisphosphokinase [Vibrio sp. Isolate22]MCG9693601.1 ribose 1,5-bisphosphokinase [Vibrio sp. Isolate22]